MKENYFKQREIKCLKEIDILLKDMPQFARQYFIGISNTTSPLTRLNYCRDLRIFLDYLTKAVYLGKTISDLTIEDIEVIDVDDFECYLSYLTRYEYNGKEECCSLRTKSRKIACVRSFYKYLFNKGKIKVNNSTKVSMPKKQDKDIIRLENNEVSGLITSVETGNLLSDRQSAYSKNTKIRDTAIIVLFLGTGIRISELVGLNRDDIDFQNYSMKITRKGGKETHLYFNDEVKNALENYLFTRKDEEQALFLSLQKKRINVRSVENLVKKYAKTVTPLKNITPHKLRSTFGTNLYRETGDIYLVATVLGHNDVNTTKKHYAAFDEDSKKIAASRVKLKNDS